jgi:predicted  nucleic acid-binding Zn-ribbon protein
MATEVSVFYSEELHRAENSLIEKTFDAEQISKEVSNFQITINNILGKIDDSDSKFKLDEITVNAEISLEGKIGIMGFGAKTTATGGITFKFTRK